MRCSRAWRSDWPSETMVSMEINNEVLKSMKKGLAFQGYNGRISSMDFHSKATNYLVTASDDESIRLYDTQNALCLKTINSKKYGVELVCFTDNPGIVLYSSKNGWDESLRLLSLNDNRFLRYFKGHLDRVVCISFCSEKENFLSGSIDRTVLLWDQRAEKSQGLLRVQGRPAVSYDDQGMVFAVAYGGHIRMFDARKFEKGPFEIFSIGNDDSEAHVIKFSSDGRRILVTTKAGRVHVLDSFHGSSIASYNVKPVVTNSTLEASFSPDGNHIISGSGDGSVYAWNVRSGKVARWGSTDNEPPLVRWAPGSLMFVTGSSELSCWVPDLSKLGSFTVTK
ncbi:hypothetical protein SETIT_3G288400v2 [Setaria italica]|uniref:Uncharacterized protein n=1 Tax=Setaria italica TaxID=4555 RepID=A0A368QJZ5_SETIT|nr:protein ANTHESIS POMOTING FACTOR 1 isoform X2 [Setaria italica]RCV18289.1 hypothetical protein SETIT_3G288400v2 [Setaria italica]